jgi:D-alanyl-D-alanine carboxypeptidase
MKPYYSAILLALGLLTASRQSSAQSSDATLLKRSFAALQTAGLPASIRKGIEASPRRFLDLLASVEQDRQADPNAFRLVDKAHPLPDTFEPADLVSLDGTSLSLSRQGHHLRKATLEALLAMDRAAKVDGVHLIIGSTYRSFAYQKVVFARNFRELGAGQAESLSAHPGFSQHQLGTALDFAPIDSSFGKTKAGKWTMANAGRFGFSLSYPEGKSAITGYDWESWHYRYIGVHAVTLQNEFFEGLQQYLMLFLHSYEG